MKHILALTTALTAVGYNAGADYGTTITLPVGRVVWGHPTKAEPATDNKGQPKYAKDGVTRLMEITFGIAIPTAEFEAKVWPYMHAEASKRYPAGAPGKFSWKIKRDTEIDPQGRPYSEREGYAGCVVLAISTVLEAPRVLRWNQDQWQQMDGSIIKCGDYVQPEVTFKVNVPTDPTNTPGLYVNPQQIAFVGHGPEIVSVRRTDPNQAFGNGPPPLPPGASATPVAGAAPLPVAPGAAPAAGMPAASMPGAPVAAMTAPAPVTPPAPPPPPAQPAGPVRPVDPAQVYDNGDGTEQWLINGAWDGQRHPIAAAAPPATLPPPATGFAAAAAGMPAAPGVPTMPGAPPPR